MELVVIEELSIRAVVLAVALSGVPLAVSMLVGLVTGILQAATQIQEQTLTFLPKLVAVGCAVFVFGPAFGGELVAFTASLLETLPSMRAY